MASAFMGVRVLDFTQNQQGPSCTVLLADMGAEVIKVEPPGGEPGRSSGLGPDGYSAYFEAHNRGKKSLVLNMRTGEAKEIVRRLIPSVDVVVENYRPGVMERWGLGYDDLAKIRSDIILASASAWGREGPWAARPGYDHVAQALSGVMSEQGGGPEAEPHALFGGLSDQLGGLTLAFGIASALWVRATTGKGQHIDSSLIGSLTSLQAMPLGRYLRTGRQPGFEFRRAATYTHYPCAGGGYMAIAANSQAMWERLCDAAAPELKTDPRFETPFNRFDNKMVLVGVLEELFATKTVDEWEELLTNADVPHAPVLTYAGVASHPQFEANGYIQEIDHAVLGKMRVHGPPVHMSATPPRIQGGGPQLAQNNEEILLELGYTWEQIEALNRAGVTAMVEGAGK
ncbi:MAG TPA: CoA transferase [Dehalococcoidia bacterium]|nr:CoA transferase [Dehalococcoidia bacterium]